RRTPAGERGEVLLVPADLPQCERVALEQVGYAGPVVEQAPDPSQVAQADAELGAARPVHTGKEGILPPPGTEMIGNPLRVSLVMGQEPGRSQQCEVLQPGQHPDLPDVTNLLLRAVIDAEGIAVLSGPAAGDRVAEPVGPLQIGTQHPEGLPLPPQQPVRGL